jgi:hypothetical protein
MTKPFPEELAEWVNQRKAKRPRQDKHVVAFLAVKSDVKAALDAGYSMKTIWEYMRETGRIEYRYETFTLHVKRFIKVPPVSVMPAASPAVGSQVKGTKPTPQQGGLPRSQPLAPKKSEAPKMGGFKFDASPNKEELL